jgi:hypothetical protein
VPFRLNCNACEFEHETADRVEAYAEARDHEAAHPTHNVFVERPG